MSNIQHEYLSCKSTITNLLELSNDLTKECDICNNADTTCIDFAKAFDTVPQKQLTYNFSLCIITGNLLKWISDYLNMRKNVCLY